MPRSSANLCLAVGMKKNLIKLSRHFWRWEKDNVVADSVWVDSAISSFINWDLLFNLSESDLENLIFNYRVCHLARISLMMLLHGSTANTASSLDPYWVLNTDQSARAPTEKYHTFCSSAAFEYYLSLDVKCRDKGTFAKFIFLRWRVVRSVHSNLLRIININFASRPPCITCWGNVLF